MTVSKNYEKYGNNHLGLEVNKCRAAIFTGAFSIQRKNKTKQNGKSK